MLDQRNTRVLSRMGARELTAEETARVSAGDKECTFRTTFIHGVAVDTQIDNIPCNS
jgi:hypothetical protein